MGQMVSILLIEDDEEYATQLRSELLTGFEIYRVSTLRDALAVIPTSKWDCIFLNLRLSDSPDFMNTAVAIHRVVQCPIWALTSLNNLAFAKRAMRAGLTGYIVKGAQRGPEISRIIRDGIAIHSRGSIRMADPIPEQASSDPTAPMGMPIGVPPGGSMDIEGQMGRMNETMQMLATTVNFMITPEQRARMLNKQEAAEAGVDEEDLLESVVKKVAKKWTVGKVLMWIAGSVGTIFSLGMTYALMVGANATDAEVEQAVHEMVIEHNGGIDPKKEGPDGLPVGHHPDIKEDLKEVKNDTESIKLKVDTIETSQNRSEKREKYQFMMSRYQTELIECQRKRGCKAPKKSPELSEIETELLLGNYD